MQFYEKHKDQRDKFEIIAFHDTTVKTMAELDGKIDELSKKLWGGKKPEFPIAMDSSGQTLRDFKIRAFPTSYLIDPDGKIALVEVGDGGAIGKMLEEKLAAAKAQKSKDAETPKEGEKKGEPTTKPAGK